MPRVAAAYVSAARRAVAIPSSARISGVAPSSATNASTAKPADALTTLGCGARDARRSGARGLRDPALEVADVLHAADRLGDAQRTVRVDRDRQLVGERFAERCFDGARLRAVRRAGGVQRDGLLLDAAARHEVPRRIVDDLVAVD